MKNVPNSYSVEDITYQPNEILSSIETTVSGVSRVGGSGEEFIVEILANVSQNVTVNYG